MILFKQNSRYFLIAFAIILAVTLFFGLKPKGYRFINQVYQSKTGSGIVFTNIGMVYGKWTLGEAGLTNSVGMVLVVKPLRTGRQLSRIAALVDAQGNDILTIDQWMDAIEVSVWDGNKKRIRRTGIDNALSVDSFKIVAIGLNNRELGVYAGEGRPEIRREIRITAGLIGNGRFLIGMAPDGGNPWRGEIAEVALFKGTTVNSGAIASAKYWNANGFFDTCSVPHPAALFRFIKIENRIIRDISGNGHNLTVPRVPRLFRYHVELIPDLNHIDKSFIADTLVNFFGFIPLGLCGFLLLVSMGCSRKKALLYAVGAALAVSLGIELWQLFIPTRSSQLIDVILNGAGALAGALGARGGGGEKRRMG